jgi:hypothetical protein
MKSTHTHRTLQTAGSTHFHHVNSVCQLFPERVGIKRSLPFIHREIENRGLFNTNKDCHVVETRQIMNIHIYQVNMAKYGDGVYHMAARIYNGLPKELKLISNDILKQI